MASAVLCDLVYCCACPGIGNQKRKPEVSYELRDMEVFPGRIGIVVQDIARKQIKQTDSRAVSDSLRKFETVSNSKTPSLPSLVRA